MIGEPDVEDDPTDINISESEGSLYIATPRIPSDKVQQPLKIRKVNIGTTIDPNGSPMLGIIGMRRLW